MFKTKLNTGYILALTSGISGGFFPIFYSQLVHKVNTPIQATTMMLFTAAIISLVFAVKSFSFNQLKQSLQGKNIILFMLLPLLMVLGNFLMVLSMTFLPPGIVYLIARLEVVFMIMIGVIFYKEKITFKLILLVIIMLSGIIIIKIGGDSGNILGSYKWYILLFPIIAALAFSVLNNVFKLLILKSFNPTFVNSYRLLLGSLVLVVFNLSVFNFGFNIWLWAFLSAVCGPLISRLTLNMSIVLISTSEALIISSLSIVITILIQITVLHIPFNWIQIIGGLCIIVPMVAVLKNRNK